MGDPSGRMMVYGSKKGYGVRFVSQYKHYVSITESGHFPFQKYV